MNAQSQVIEREKKIAVTEHLLLSTALVLFFFPTFNLMRQLPLHLIRVYKGYDFFPKAHRTWYQTLAIILTRAV